MENVIESPEPVVEPPKKPLTMAERRAAAKSRVAARIAQSAEPPAPEPPAPEPPAQEENTFENVSVSQ